LLFALDNRRCPPRSGAVRARRLKPACLVYNAWTSCVQKLESMRRSLDKRDLAAINSKDSGSKEKNPDDSKGKRLRGSWTRKCCSVLSEINDLSGPKKNEAGEIRHFEAGWA